MRSGLPRYVPTSAHDWGQVLMFQCKSEDSVKQNLYNYVGESTSTFASEKGPPLALWAPQGKHEKRAQEREVPI